MDIEHRRVPGTVPFYVQILPLGNWIEKCLINYVSVLL